MFLPSGRGSERLGQSDVGRMFNFNHELFSRPRIKKIKQNIKNPKMLNAEAPNNQTHVPSFILVSLVIVLASTIIAITTIVEQTLGIFTLNIGLRLQSPNNKTSNINQYNQSTPPQSSRASHLENLFPEICFLAMFSNQIRR